MLDPYARSGLARNPFAWVDGRDGGPFVEHLGLDTPRPSQGFLRQLIGDKGAGKTTHLRNWQATTRGEYFYVEPGAPLDPPIGPLVYWDEADRLSDRRLRSLFREAREADATIVAGTHRDLGRPARRAGLPVETTEIGSVSFDLLRAWTDTRIAAVVDGPEAAGNIVVSDEALCRLLEQPGMTLREAGDELHRIVARQVRGE